MRDSKHICRFAVLPAIHLCLCAYVAATGDVWKWILLSLVDFPILYLQKYAGDPLKIALINPIGVATLGALWWLCIGVALLQGFDWLVRKLAPAKSVAGE